MEIADFAAAIAIGNILTLSAVWGFRQFHLSGHNAPWLAYAAFLMPIIIVALSFAATAPLPPPLDALATQ